jgi:hypothetical protein
MLLIQQAMLMRQFPCNRNVSNKARVMAFLRETSTIIKETTIKMVTMEMATIVVVAAAMKTAVTAVMKRWNRLIHLPINASIAIKKVSCLNAKC